MKKRLIAIAFLFALIAGMIPSASLPEVSAKAMSNASALTPLVYQKGSYVALGKIKLYTAADGKKSTGKSVPEGAEFKVTSVKNEFGKTTYDGKTGWVNLGYAYNPANKKRGWTRCANNSPRGNTGTSPRPTSTIPTAIPIRPARTVTRTSAAIILTGHASATAFLSSWASTCSAFIRPNGNATTI